jgi:hypothetical protein
VLVVQVMFQSLIALDRSSFYWNVGGITPGRLSLGVISRHRVIMPSKQAMLEYGMMVN